MILQRHNVYVGINKQNSESARALLSYAEGSGHGRQLDPEVYRAFYDWLSEQVRVSEIEATS